jgi:hypothetical protein
MTFIEKKINLKSIHYANVICAPSNLYLTLVGISQSVQRLDFRTSGLENGVRFRNIQTGCGAQLDSYTGDYFPGLQR